MRPGFILLLSLLSAASSHASDPKVLRWDASSFRQVHDPGPGFYCYAPAVIQEANQTRVVACLNATPFVVRDHLYLLPDGSAARPTPVLSPSEGNRWDSFHVCDPSIVRGRFALDAVTYRYALFYLGNAVDECRDNQIGVAFANDLAGPWRRLPKPLIPDTPDGHWGTGQPSAVSLDRAGRLLLFYTSGNPRTVACVRQLDLSDASRPVLGDETRLPTAGLTRPDGRRDHLNNFDVVLDEPRARLLAVREQHPYPTTQPTFVTPSLQICSLPLSDLRNPAARWTVLGNLTPAATGFPRNHNAAFARDPHGRLPDPGRLRIFFSISDEEPRLNGLFAPFTYRLHEISAPLDPPVAVGH